MEKEVKSCNFVKRKKIKEMDELNWEEISQLSGGIDIEDKEPVIEEELIIEESNTEEFTEEKVVETPIVETVEEVVETETDSFKLLQLMIETGQIEDSVIEVEGREIQLSDFKDLDKETLKDIVNTFKTNDEVNIKENYVSLKNLDETKKALVDIIVRGDYDQIKEVLKETEDVLKDPFEGYDSTNNEHNAQVYYAYLVKEKGNTEEEAKALIDVALKNNSLDTKAIKIIDSFRENSKKVLEEKKQKIAQEAEEKKVRIKEYSKNLDETLKMYDIKPEKVLEYKKLATQYDSEGNLPIDKLYDQSISDPSKAAELIMFLTDKELYDKIVFSKAKKISDVETIKKIQIVKTGSKKSNNDNEVKRDVTDGTSFLDSIIIED